MWTGNELVIWGGEDSVGNLLNTGAKYDINTNTWTKLTQSPLNPSNELYYYFNGQEVVITLRYPYSYNNWGNVSSYRSEISSYNIQNNVWTNPYYLGSSLNPSNTRSFIYDDTKLIAASSGPYSVFEDGLHHNNNSINDIEIPSGWGRSYVELVKVDSNLTYLINEQGELYSLKTAYLIGDYDQDLINSIQNTVLEKNYFMYKKL